MVASTFKKGGCGRMNCRSKTSLQSVYGPVHQANGHLAHQISSRSWSVKSGVSSPWNSSMGDSCGTPVRDSPIPCCTSFTWAAACRAAIAAAVPAVASRTTARIASACCSACGRSVGRVSGRWTSIGVSIEVDLETSDLTSDQVSRSLLNSGQVLGNPALK